MCGEIRTSDVGSEVALCGWVARNRDHGGVTFIDLRDRAGLVQLVFHPEHHPEAHEVAQRLRGEWVVRVVGTVQPRPEGTVNDDMETGAVEVAVETVEVLNSSETPPFEVEDRIEANEEARLKYRYVDLRRPEMTRMLALRAQINRIMRDHMDSLGFLEVETPLLGKSTPEGSRDFLVPSRLQPGTFYALPQSPQQMKQLLMVAGQDRYYQIVRCLRDEAPRADRGFEFTQLDIEMSFIDEEDIYAVIEPLYARLLKETVGATVEIPFPRMTFDEMVERFGSDKADLRYGLELRDLAEAFRATEFNAFSKVLADGGRIKAICVPGGGILSRKDLDQLIADAKGRGAAGLVWMIAEGGGLRSPIDKFLSPEELAAIRETAQAADGDLVCIVADSTSRVHVALDGLRRDMAARFDLISPDTWNLCWLTEPPLFEFSEDEGRWVAMHHPFTSPASDDLQPETAKARAYDLVLNGFEIGGGSIRIHDAATQQGVFEALQLDPEQIDREFGHLLTAFRFGAPPHGGIAMGTDRLAMLLSGKDSLRDVTAFPKAQSGQDPLTGAPAKVAQAQLDDLSLVTTAEEDD